MRKLAFRSWKLRSKLIFALVFFILIPTLFSSYYLYRGYSGSLLEQVGDSQAQVVDRINYEVDQSIRSIALLTMVPYTNTDFQDILEQNWSENKNAYVLQLSKIVDNVMFSNYQTNLQAVYIFKPDGLVFSLTNNSSILDNANDWKNEDWYQAAMKQQGLPVFVPLHRAYDFNKHLEAKNGAITYSVAREIRNMFSGEPMGIFLVDGKPEQIHKVIASVRLPKGGNITVLDQNNRVVTDLKGSPIMTSYSEVPLQTDGWYVSQGSEPRLVSVKKSDYTGWKVISSIPINTLLNKTERNKAVFLVSLFVSTVLCMLTFFFVSQGFVRPILQLRKLMRKMEMGEFPLYENNTARDEIGELSESFNHMSMRLKHLVERDYRMQIRASELRFLALRSKINPHFLYNTLESITMKLVTAKDFRTAETISMLGNYFKNMMQDKPDYISLRDEIASVESYMAMQSIRFGDRFLYDIHIDPRIADKQVPCFILQPLVENSILHGIEGLPRQGMVVIDASLEDVKDDGDRTAGRISIRIQDNGVGMSLEKLASLRQKLSSDMNETGGEYGRVGMKNVWERLYLLYDKELIFDIRSEANQGTVVTISFPLLAAQWAKEEQTDA